MLDLQSENSTTLSTLMNASPNLIVITDGTLMNACNKAFLEFSGFASLEDFKKNHTCICDLFEPYTPKALLRQMEGMSWIEVLLARPKAHLAYLKKEGKIHVFAVHAEKVIIQNDILYSAIFNDVTELEMQKERYAQAIEGSQIGIWDWNLEDNTIYFGKRWKEMLGFKEDELPNAFASWEERVHPEDLPLALLAIQDNVEGRSEYYACTHRLRHKDGSWIWIDDRGKTFFNQEGKAVRMVGVHNDVSRIKESEAINHLHALRAETILLLPSLNETLEEAEFMQRALELVEDLTRSVISFIHFVNDGETSIELVTWSKRTLNTYCHSVHDTHYPATQAGIWADALRQRKAVVINDYTNYAFKKGLPEGHASLERFISMPVLEDGKVVMICGIGNKTLEYDENDTQTLQLIANEIWRLVQRKRNLANIKRTQELLIAQSRNAAMGEMVSMIAHQWRQPISVIGMCANNMLLDMELESIEPQEFAKQLRDILSQIEHLSSTIDDFRNFFKPNKNKESVTVESVLEDALKLLQKSFDNNAIFISCTCESHTPLLIYRRELMQVFLNILKNAKEAFEQKKKKSALSRFAFLKMKPM